MTPLDHGRPLTAAAGTDPAGPRRGLRRPGRPRRRSVAVALGVSAAALTGSLQLGLAGTPEASADTVAVTPQAARWNLVRELRVTGRTGADGLAAGGTVSVEVQLRGGAVRSTPLTGQSFAAGATFDALVPLDRTTLVAEIASVGLRYRSSSTDRWDLASLAVSFDEPTGKGTLVSQSGNPLRRFTSTTPVRTYQLAAAPGAIKPARVDLRAGQTGIRDQGTRGTCTQYAAAAAIEAAYKRVGVDVDLSEELLNWTQKLFWLDQGAGTTIPSGRTENQVGIFSGGTATGLLARSAAGLRTPAEGFFPEHTSEYPQGASAQGGHDWFDSFWQTQRNADDVNLDPALLPRKALTAPTYYRAATARSLKQPRNADEIEAVLTSGREVTIDVEVTNPSSDLWTPCSDGTASCSIGQHAMLVVGYDRTDPDPAKHYFIVKNSWGPKHWSAHPDGFTYLRYDYLQEALEAGYVGSVASPAAWPELAFTGRWDVTLAGKKGTLDVYHQPGIAQDQLGWFGVATPDRRIGTFYDAAGTAYRVNGRITGDTMETWIDPAQPNLPLDRLSGTKTAFRLADGALVPVA